MKFINNAILNKNIIRKPTVARETILFESEIREKSICIEATETKQEKMNRLLRGKIPKTEKQLKAMLREPKTIMRNEQ